ncbi:ribonuclease HII [Candidatus Saccharibacteria bacterium]|nr:ribonuclease HII [Candidatus Saccharibacteria bacterium]MCB9821605.1 ribonuclease HII [Candidatus Nomurabacteria bacterium]
MKYVIGVDEAGRGAWAGPFTAAAICFVGSIPAGLNDSKKLTSDQRQAAYKTIIERQDHKAVVFVESCDIDKYGLTWAQTYSMGLAVKQVLESLNPGSADEVELIIDGNVNYLGQSDAWETRVIAKADSIFAEVMAASILAKVERDMRMRQLANAYKNYGFEKHVGYGTKAHRDALSRYGISDIHRKSFSPIKKLL